MEKDSVKSVSILRVLFRVIQGAVIGLGAVLPGISGGVLCVVFGIYKPIMELLSHPLKNFKTHVPKLLPGHHWLGRGVYGDSQFAVVFPGEISGAFGLFVRGAHCRHDALPVS